MYPKEKKIEWVAKTVEIDQRSPFATSDPYLHRLLRSLCHNTMNAFPYIGGQVS